MMKNLGLRADDLNQIVEKLAQFPEIESAVVFGSRAKGTAQRGSDIDIALVGEQLTASIVNQIYDALEERTTLPYFFDVVNLAEINNPSLEEHIHRVGIEIYKKPAPASTHTDLGC